MIRAPLPDGAFHVIRGDVGACCDCAVGMPGTPIHMPAVGEKCPGPPRLSARTRNCRRVPLGPRKERARTDFPN